MRFNNITSADEDNLLPLTFNKATVMPYLRALLGPKWD